MTHQTRSSSVAWHLTLDTINDAVPRLTNPDSSLLLAVSIVAKSATARVQQSLVKRAFCA